MLMMKKNNNKLHESNGNTTTVKNAKFHESNGRRNANSQQ